METLLVNEAVAADILPELAEQYQTIGVELRGCEKTLKVLPQIVAATEDDWATEYLAPVLSIKLVADMDEAIAHINRYGSHHTDSIITENYTKSRAFLREVDSSSVMVNASTRFADGSNMVWGLKSVSLPTKIHARGPVGLDGLTSEKYVVLGDGHIRQ